MLEQTEHALKPWVSYFIVPAFAFVNAGVSLAGTSLSTLRAPIRWESSWVFSLASNSAFSEPPWPRSNAVFPNCPLALQTSSCMESRC